MTTLSELQLSALREVANIGAGNAATSLATLVGRPVDLGVPLLELVPLEAAAERIGPLEEPVAAVLTPLRGDVAASLLLVLPEPSATDLCALLGTDPAEELGRSCLQEVGNILTAAYATSLAGFTGLALEPAPPLLALDMLGAVVDAVLAGSAGGAGTVLFLQTSLAIDGTACPFGFLVVPQDDAVGALLRALGVA